MNSDFSQLTEAVMNHITAQNYSKATKGAYRRCFYSLTTFLDEKGVIYTQEEADV